MLQPAERLNRDTGYRHDPPEDVYIYRVQGPRENGRRLLMASGSVSGKKH